MRINQDFYPIRLPCIELLFYYTGLIDDGFCAEFLRVEPLAVEHDIQADLVHVFELLFRIINAVWMDGVAIV